MEKPEIVTNKHLEYLDALRESGVTNMFGAASYVEDEFGTTSSESRDILKYWMKSFADRNPQG